MIKNIIEKIWDLHALSGPAGHPDILSIDLMLIHEVTSAQAFAELEQRHLSVMEPEKMLATLDHSIPTTHDREWIQNDQARVQVETLRNNAQKYNLQLHDFGSGRQGIVHVVAPEMGRVLPGMTIVCGDSHTSTHGAFGALAFGIGTTEVGHVLATGSLLQNKPRTMRIHFSGTRPPFIQAKDMVLKLIAEIGIAGANGHIVEFSGPCLQTMSMEERMTLCNMSIECGARAGLIAPDEVTISYLSQKRSYPNDANWVQKIKFWLSLRSDEGCSFDRELTIDISDMKPMVSWGINPEQSIAVTGTIPEIIESWSVDKKNSYQKAQNYTELKAGQAISGLTIDYAFLGSCTNGRLEDFRTAAEVMRGKKIHPRVTMLVVPGSEHVLQQAKNEGLIDIFLSAGADVRQPGCSMCIAMNEDKVPAGKRCISTSNRNFIGRQGPGSRTHLASPATVAASAIAGEICSFLESTIHG